MSKDNIWAFLEEIENIPIIAQQPERIYEYFATLQKAEKSFEVGIEQCYAEGDQKTIETAKQRLRKYLQRKGEFVASALQEYVNGLVMGEEKAEAQRQYEEIISGLVSDALEYIESIEKEHEPSPREPIEKVATKQEPEKDTGWYTTKQVSEKYKIPYNNVKDRKWREKVGFPVHQEGGAYSSVRFNATEIEEWLSKH